MTISIVEENSIQLNKFSDKSTEKNFTYEEAGNKTTYVKLPHEAIIDYVSVWIRGGVE